MAYASILIAAALAAAAPAREPATAPARKSRPRRAAVAALKLEPVSREPAAIGRAKRVRAAPTSARPVVTHRSGTDRPAWRVAGGVPLTWRSASAVPESGTRLQFRTETPYLGVDLEAQSFPRRAVPGGSLPAWAEPLGLSLSLSHRVLTSRVADEKLDSREQRAALEALYEQSLPAGTRLTGRVGWAWHRFSVDESEVIGTLTHHGPRFGLDAAHPVHPRVDALVGARVMPWTIVGGTEAQARGDASDAWGAEILLGFGGPIPHVGGVGWRATYDYLRFSDRFGGSGARSTGGTGTASHHAILVGATWAR